MIQMMITMMIQMMIQMMIHDDEEYGWDSERKNFRMPGEFMSLINSYIDEGEQRRRDRGYSDWADFLHPDHAVDDEQVIATMRKT